MKSTPTPSEGDGPSGCNRCRPGDGWTALLVLAIPVFALSSRLATGGLRPHPLGHLWVPATAVLTGEVFRLVHRRVLVGWLNVHGYLLGLAAVAVVLGALGALRATGAVDRAGSALVLVAAALLLGLEGKHLTHAGNGPG